MLDRQYKKVLRHMIKDGKEMIDNGLLNSSDFAYDSFHTKSIMDDKDLNSVYNGNFSSYYYKLENILLYILERYYYNRETK